MFGGLHAFATLEAILAYSSSSEEEHSDSYKSYSQTQQGTSTVQTPEPPCKRARGAAAKSDAGRVQHERLDDIQQAINDITITLHTRFTLPIGVGRHQALPCAADLLLQPTRPLGRLAALYKRYMAREDLRVPDTFRPSCRTLSATLRFSA